MIFRSGWAEKFGTDAFFCDFPALSEDAAPALKELGIRITAPYTFDLKGLLTEGENDIEIIVANTLAGMIPQELSTFFQIPRSGLLGPVELVY